MSQGNSVTVDVSTGSKCHSGRNVGGHNVKAPEQVRYRIKLTSIFLVRYRTKIWDAGMPMPALVSSMPIPSYMAFTSQKHALERACRLKYSQNCGLIILGFH